MPTIALIALIADIVPLWLFALYLSVSKYRMRIKHIEEMRELRKAYFLVLWRNRKPHGLSAGEIARWRRDNAGMKD